MRILLLEDERMLRLSIKEYLEASSHQVTDVVDGKAALELISPNTYELLLLDINTPEINGFEVVERLLKRHVRIPTIFISALVDIDDISRGYELGCIDYIKKPFHLKELVLKIEKLMQRALHKPQASDMIALSSAYRYSIAENTLYYLEEPQKMNRRWLQIIRLLTDNLGIVVGFDKFRQQVWDNEMIDNATIRAEINRLKKALQEDFVRNSRGLGYFIEKGE